MFQYCKITVWGIQAKTNCKGSKKTRCCAVSHLTLESQEPYLTSSKKKTVKWCEKGPPLSSVVLSLSALSRTILSQSCLAPSNAKRKLSSNIQLTQDFLSARNSAVRKSCFVFTQLYFDEFFLCVKLPGDCQNSNQRRIMKKNKQWRTFLALWSWSGVAFGPEYRNKM